MHTIIKIAVVSVLALFTIVGVVSISKAKELGIITNQDASIDDCIIAFKTEKVINRLEYNAKNNVAVCRIVFKSSLEYF